MHSIIVDKGLHWSPFGLRPDWMPKGLNGLWITRNHTVCYCTRAHTRTHTLHVHGNSITFATLSLHYPIRDDWFNRSGRAVAGVTLHTAKRLCYLLQSIYTWYGVIYFICVHQQQQHNGHTSSIYKYTWIADWSNFTQPIQSARDTCAHTLPSFN